MKQLMLIDLPSDLLHFIIHFLVNDCIQLLKLREISKTWKIVCEHSLLWLQLDLKFKSPHNYVLPRNHLEINSICINLFSDYTSSVHPRYGTIILKRDLTIINDPSSGTTERMNPIATTINLSTNRFEQAFEISSYFINLYCYYQKVWLDYHRFTTKWTRVRRILRDRLSNWTILVKIVGTISLTVASELLLFISLQSIHTVSTILGFILLYLYLFLYLLILVALAAKRIIDNFLDDFNPSSYQVRLNIEPVIEYVLIVCVFLAIFFCLILIQVKLSFFATQTSFSWMFVTIPAWLFPMLAIVIMLKEVGKTGEYIQRNLMITFVIFLIFIANALGCLLVAFYYDNNGKDQGNNLQFAIIPFLPLILICTLFVVADLIRGLVEASYSLLLSFRFYILELRRNRLYEILRVFFSCRYCEYCFLKSFWWFSLFSRILSVFISTCLIVLVYDHQTLQNTALTLGVKNLPSVMGLLVLASLFLHCGFLHIFPV